MSLKIFCGRTGCKNKKIEQQNTKDQKACGGRQWGIRGEPCPIFIFPPLSSSPLRGKTFFLLFSRKEKGGEKNRFFTVIMYSSDDEPDQGHDLLLLLKKN